MEWPNGQRGWRPPFIVPEGNLPIGVLENRTCPMERQTSLRNLPGIWYRALDMSDALGLSHWKNTRIRSRGRTYPILPTRIWWIGLNMFGAWVEFGETGHVRTIGQTYPTLASGVRWWSPDMYGGLRILGYWTCMDQGPDKSSFLSGIQQLGPDISGLFLESWLRNLVLRFLTSLTHPMCPSW
jgi:hypothetical protein